MTDSDTDTREPTDPSENGEAKAPPEASGAPPDPKADLRNAIDSLKSAAGALFGQFQPPVKEVLGEAEKIVKQAAEGAGPAANAAKDEATKAAQQISESAKPFAKTVGEQLHKLSDVMADAVDSGVKGAGVAAETVKEAFTGKKPGDSDEE